MRRALERLSIWIGDAMHQGRAALNSLRGSIVQTNDLAEALRLVATSDLRHPSTAVKVSVDGTACDLHPIVRDEVYAIASEALRNALRHSGAREVIVKITYSRDLTIHVVDNGVGIDTATLESGRDGHFGLKGMRERATRIRAKLTISTPAGGGTDLQLVVPRSFVFKDAKTRRNWIPSPNPDRVRTASRTSRNPGSTP
jgi:signal transduction histidine kinase